MHVLIVQCYKTWMSIQSCEKSVHLIHLYRELKEHLGFYKAGLQTIGRPYMGYKCCTGVVLDLYM